MVGRQVRSAPADVPWSYSIVSGFGSCNTFSFDFDFALI